MSAKREWQYTCPLESVNLHSLIEKEGTANGLLLKKTIVCVKKLPGLVPQTANGPRRHWYEHYSKEAPVNFYYTAIQYFFQDTMRLFKRGKVAVLLHLGHLT